jgi:hypothetical protein
MVKNIDVYYCPIIIYRNKLETSYDQQYNIEIASISPTDG